MTKDVDEHGNAQYTAAPNCAPPLAAKLHDLYRMDLALMDGMATKVRD